MWELGFSEEVIAVLSSPEPPWVTESSMVRATAVGALERRAVLEAVVRSRV